MLDATFKALSNPLRRQLLDMLRQRDGQTLRELCEAMDITRTGVMKHLTILREGGLVSVRHVGRETFHYLNPVPLYEIERRWISQYAAPFVKFMTDLKQQLEVPVAHEPELPQPAHQFVTYIRTNAQALWAAISDPNITQKYFFNMYMDSGLKPGSPYRMLHGGDVKIHGTIEVVEPPHRLVQTFCFADVEEPSSRVTWEIEELGGVCKLTLFHDELARESKTLQMVKQGWPVILSSLKTLLETHDSLSVPDDLAFPV